MTRGIERKIVSSKKEMLLDADIHNRFEIEVVDSITGRIKQIAKAENIILNSLWSSFGGYWNQFIHYGSGAGTPVATRTSLFNFVGAIQSVDDSTTFTDNLYSLKTKVTLTETMSVGVTITEIGIANTSSSNSLKTHAMLKDMNGNQISILKTNTDIINIYATVFVHLADNLPVIFTKDFLKYFAGRSYNSPVRYSIADAPMLGVRDFENQNFNKPISLSFDVSTRKLTLTGDRMPANQGNCKGIYGLYLFNYVDANNFPGVWADTLKWFPGSDIVGEAIGTGDGVKTDFATTFPLISTAKIYVNGVEDYGVTTHRAPFSNLGQWAYLNGQIIDNKFVPVAVSSSYALSPISGTQLVGYNRFYDNIDVATIVYTIKYYSGIQKVYISDDLINWIDCEPWSTTVSSTVTVNVPSAYKNYRYIKAEYETVGSSGSIGVGFSTAKDKNIHFASPPANGAVITADYHTDLIAKDVNHVFDFSFTIQFAERTT